MRYHMPTIIIEEENAVRNHSDLFGKYGKKALIVTGRSSAKINGALDDVLYVLKEQGIDHVLFDQVVENPPIEQVSQGARLGAGCDFVIGIGGGSPIDAAKGIAILIRNPSDNDFDMLYTPTGADALPLIAIPTTSGTGTETTPYAVFTDHNLGTKTSMKQRVFPEYALLDVKYFMHMPLKVRNSTCVDALTHSIESYMTSKTTKYVDYIAMESIRLWGDYKEALLRDEMDEEAMTAFMTASTLAGMAISQTGTSLPHTMGYPLTYNFGYAHGVANGIFMASYLNFCENKWRVSNIMDALGFESLDDFDDYLKKVLGHVRIDEALFDGYADEVLSNKRKLGQHPGPVTKEDIITIYRESIGE